MCANSAYKASALRPCKNQSANAEPCVRMRLESASRIVNALSVPFIPECEKQFRWCRLIHFAETHFHSQTYVSILWFVGFGNDARNVLFQDV